MNDTNGLLREKESDLMRLKCETDELVLKMTELESNIEGIHSNINNNSPKDKSAETKKDEIPMNKIIELIDRIKSLDNNFNRINGMIEDLRSILI